MTSNQIFRDAILYMYANLERAPTLDEIAAAAGTSVTSLKRAFDETVGQGPGALLRRLRLELAFQSLRSRSVPVIEAALASGFEDHSAFSRSFKRAFGFAPSSARKKLCIQRELESVEVEEPDLVELEGITLQSVTTRGLYFECAPRAWSALEERLASVSPDKREGALFVGMALDDPHQGAVREAEVRFVAGVQGVAEDLGLESASVERGRYARFRFEGRLANIGLAYHYIYGAFRGRPDAPRFLDRPAPCFFEHIPRGPGDARVMICVPIESAMGA